MSVVSSIGHFEKVRALHATPRFVVTGGFRASGGASELRIHDWAAGKPVHTVKLAASVTAMCGDNDVVVAGCSDGFARVIDLASGAVTAEHRLHEGAVTALALQAGGGGAGKRLLSGGADGRVRFVDLTTGEVKGALPQGGKLSSLPLRAVAFDDKGEVGFTGGDDGIARSFSLSDKPMPGAATTGAGAVSVREMAGHDGPIFAVAYLPREQRLATGGDDGTVRLWYLTGDVEHEKKGNDQDAHTGAVTALLHVAGEPLPGQDPTDRLYSASADGTVKAWRLEDRKKPRTVDGGGDGVFALAFVPRPAAGATGAAALVSDRGAGTLFFGGDKRTVSRVVVDAGGQMKDAVDTHGHGFTEMQQELAGGARPKREAAVELLFGLVEREARDLLAKSMQGDKEPELRAHIVKQAAARNRQDLRDAVKATLDDGDGGVRFVAFDALLALDQAKGPLSAIRAALKGVHPAVRRRALDRLVSLAGTSPLLAGLVTERLTDNDAGVRLHALASLVALDLAERRDPPVDALVTAYTRGPADVKTWVLVRAARSGLVAHPALAAVFSRALDDDDAEVRKTSFALRVLVRKDLAERLEASPDLVTTEIASSFKEALKRIAALEAGGDPQKAATASDEEVGIARMVLPPFQGAREGDVLLEPLLVAMACRTPDTALRGSLALAVLKDGRALGALLQLSRESDPNLRKGAVTGLRSLADERAKKRLSWMLDDGDAGVRAAAYDAVAKLDAAEPLLVADQALRASFEDIRARGLELLIKVGREDERARLLLEEAIEDESAKVRAEAFRTLWTWHGADPRVAIERGLVARFPDTRLRAVEELAARSGIAPSGNNAGTPAPPEGAWARPALLEAIGDVDAGVGKAAFEHAQKAFGDKDAGPVLAALASNAAAVRAVGAQRARKVVLTSGNEATVRSELTKALLDDDAGTRTSALESLDALFPSTNGPLITGLQGKHLDLRVRAAELLALRKDEQLIDTMRTLLEDKELPLKVGPAEAQMLRRRAAGALATLGAQRNVKFLQALIQDTTADPQANPQNVGVREEAARGLASSCRRGDEPVLLDAMGHGEIWVRSWAAEGLARLGDVRALPVLTGTLRHDHLPIRRGAILAFAAFGPEGYSGMLAGLEDKDEEIEQIVFAIVLAHDLQLLKKGRAPDFLATALSSQRAEVRFAAARALEMRTDANLFLAHLVEVLGPQKPEKVSDMTPEKGWPEESERNRLLRALADAMGSDSSERRYAAAQALLHKKNPRDFWKVAADVAKLRPATSAVVPDTRPRPISLEGDAVEMPGPESPTPSDGRPRGAREFFRRLFSSDSPSSPGAGQSASTTTMPDGNVVVVPAEQDRLRRLAFGAYVGLLRQVIPGDDSQRVRRDAVDRIVDLGKQHLGVAAALPALVRALDDAHHLVRKAALAGLKNLVGVDEAQRLGLASPHADVARAVLDELFAGGAARKNDIARGLASENAEVRKTAFELLEKLAPKDGAGALEPLLLALSSPHADLRLGVLERMASSNDPRVLEALLKALGSDHDDLRLRAAELLGKREDARAADILGSFLRHDNATLVGRARSALAGMRHTASIAALAARLDEVSADASQAQAQHIPLLQAIAGAARLPARSAVDPAPTAAMLEVATAAISVLVRYFGHESDAVRMAAFQAGLTVLGPKRRDRVASLEMQLLPPATKAKDPALRLAAAGELERTDDDGADAVLLALFTDRDTPVRAAAVTSYALRVRRRNTSVAPLLDVLKKGQRELVLPAGEGVAQKNDSAALVPLLLVTRAGEPGERERALIALGALGDPRALDEIFTIAQGGTAEAPAEPSMKVAATEALGRLYNKVSAPDDRARIWEHLDGAAAARDAATLEAALRGLISIGDARARARIETVLGEPSAPPSSLLLAANALRMMGDKESEPALVQALSHWNYEVALAAKRALDALFPNDKVRLAFLLVGLTHAQLAGPAASFLAEEGDPKELLARLPDLKSDDLRERIRFGLLRRGQLPAEAVAALVDDARVRARANALFLVGARAARFSDADRAVLAGALFRGEERCAQGYAGASAQDRQNELSTWLRLWVAARKLAVRAEPSLLQLAKRRMQTAPGPIRAAAARYIGAAGGTDDVLGLVPALADVDGNVRQAVAAVLASSSPALAAQAANDSIGASRIDPIARAWLVDPAFAGRRAAAVETVVAAGGFGAGAAAATSPPAAQAAARARDALAADAVGRAAVLPSLWRDREGAALLDRAQNGDRGAVEALGWIDNDIARAALYEMAGDDEIAEDLRKLAYRALRRNNRRKANAARAATAPFSLTAGAGAVATGPAVPVAAAAAVVSAVDDDEGDDEDDDEDEGDGDDE